MHDKRLHIYLDDHLALMVAEIELANRCRKSNLGTPIGELLQQIVNEVNNQKSIVKEIIYRIGGKEGVESKLKQSAAWFAEKLGRFKLNDSLLKYSELSRVIELEALAAAAQGRIGFWDNFDTVAGNDTRLEGITCSFFREQSRHHLDQLNDCRLTAAAEAFID